MKELDFSAIRQAREACGLSRQKVADAIGISAIALRQYEAGICAPSAKVLAALATFFGTSMEALCGLEKPCAQQPEIEQMLERESYEMWLGLRNKAQNVPGTPVPVWPYNLLEAIFGEPWVDPLTADQEQGLQKALDSLTRREHETIEAVYKDSNNLRAAAQAQGVSRQCTRQYLATAVRKLRHVTKAVLIMRGLSGTAAYYRGLDKRAEALNKREATVLERERILKAQEAAILEAQKSIYGDPNTRLEACGLSTRAYNALKNHGCLTVRDVYEAVEKLASMRNVGVKTKAEILDLLHAFGYRLRNV